MRTIETVSANTRAPLQIVALLTASVMAGAPSASAQTMPVAPLNLIVSAGTGVVGTVVVSVSPRTARIQPGSPIQFSATVTGSANQVVLWTATGGSITPQGKYTSATATGAYSVTATLQYGSTSGSASVTIDAGLYADIAPGEDIQARIEAMPAGTVFNLRTGVHRIASMLSPKDRMVFGGEAGAVLSGATELTTFTRSGTAWVASGQTQQGTVYVASEGGLKVCRADYPRCLYPEDLFVNDVPLKHVTGVADGGPGKWFFDYTTDQIYFWDDPAGKKVETSVTPVAIGGGATAVTIRGLIIEKFAAHAQVGAVQLGTSWILEDSEVRWNHFSGVDSYSNSIARRNFVHDNGCFGFHGSGDTLLVEKNEISYNGYAGFDPYWGAGGSKWAFTKDLTVRGNFSHHNLGPGLWTDINNIYTLYEENTVEDNERAGIFHEISYDATIRYNTLRRNGTSRVYPYWTTHAGIEVVASRNVEVYGNTLVDNWQGITGLEDHRGSGYDGPWTLVNFHVHDNTVTSMITDQGTGRSGLVDTSGTGVFSAEANNRFRQNNYTYSAGSATKYFIWNANERTDAEWRSYGQDLTGNITR